MKSIFRILTLCLIFGIFISSVYAEGFSDVGENDWFYQDVLFVSDKGLMMGTDTDKFSPNDTTTRGMIVTVLWRLDGKIQETENPFSDVNSEEYYYNAVSWAYKNGIVSGYDATTFGANDFITREQLAAIMYRYAEYNGYDISNKLSLDKYQDSNDVSEYSVSAFEWANANGIITGVADDTLLPKGNALRCQVASIFKRFSDKFAEKEVAVENEKNKESKIIVSGGGGTNTNTNAPAKPTDNQPEIEEEGDNVTLTVGNATVNAGDDVSISVEVKNNPGILGMLLTIAYQIDCIELTDAQNGEAFDGVLYFTKPEAFSGEDNFIWDGADISDENIKDGVFLNLEFHIPETTPSGTYPIRLSYEEEAIADKDLREIIPKVINGYIKVK